MRLVVSRVFRRLHGVRESDPVPGDLRGWRWDEPPVKPRAYLGLGVSEVAYRYCSTMRDVWLRRRAGVSGEARGVVAVGAGVHEVFRSVSRDLRFAVSRGLEPWAAYDKLYHSAPSRVGSLGGWAVRLYRLLALLWSAEAAYAESFNGGLGWLPWLVEHVVDGSPLGLSPSLRVDALGEAGVVVEVKLGSRRSRRHEVGLAGYALALEAAFEAPVDYGLIVYVNSLESRTPRIRAEPVYLSADLREEFLEARDEAIEVLLSPDPPPVAGECPESCPLLEACHGGGGSG